MPTLRDDAGDVNQANVGATGAGGPGGPAVTARFFRLLGLAENRPAVGSGHQPETFGTGPEMR
jgi:hypothetical protein